MNDLRFFQLLLILLKRPSTSVKRIQFLMNKCILRDFRNSYVVSLYYQGNTILVTSRLCIFLKEGFLIVLV